MARAIYEQFLILCPVRYPISGFGDVMAVFTMVLERQGEAAPKAE